MLKETTEAKDFELGEVEPICDQIFRTAYQFIISASCKVHNPTVVASCLREMLFEFVVL